MPRQYTPRHATTCERCGTAFTVPAFRASSARYCCHACKVAAARGAFAQKFWARVRKGDGCWEWQGHIGHYGYGIVYHDTKLARAHRCAYELTHGPILNNLCVLHRCDNRRCVRPDHLFLGTHLDNAQDCKAKGRTLTGDRNHIRQHPERVRRGEQSTAAKLTEVQVREIRARYAAGGTSYKRLAREYGMSAPTIGEIIRRDIWRHI